MQQQTARFVEKLLMTLSAKNSAKIVQRDVALPARSANSAAPSNCTMFMVVIHLFTDTYTCITFQMLVK